MTEQEKREKVINNLEYQIHLLYDIIPHVSRDDGEYLEAAAKTMSDALALLKAQEPRVMTFDEVKRHYNLPPVFFDDLDMQEDYYQDIQPLYFEFPNPTAWDVHWRGSNQVRTYLDEWEDRYNNTWRCWTSRPDEKRRAETPWN